MEHIGTLIVGQLLVTSQFSPYMLFKDKVVNIFQQQIGQHMIWRPVYFITNDTAHNAQNNAQRTRQKPHNLKTLHLSLSYYCPHVDGGL